MIHQLLNFAQAADFLHIASGELKHLAVQGEINYEMRGEQMFFHQEDLDLWASRHVVLGDAPKDQQPLKPLKQRRIFKTLSQLCPKECVCAALPGTTRATIIAQLANLADNSGFLYDPNDLKEAITRREEEGSTNIGNGIALPHPLIRDETVFSDSFICIAKLAKPSFFNSAEDGLPTEILLLSCSADSEEHLYILRKISALCRSTNFIQLCKEAEDDDQLYDALIKCEEKLATSKG